MGQRPPPPGSPDETVGPVRAPGPLPLRFRFEETLGEGGLGTVVKAFDTRLRIHVAIKTIRHDLAGRDPGLYDHLSDRFEREAIAGARVRDSPHVVTVYDLIVDEARNAFLILEFMPGGTLKDRLARGSLPIADALRLAGDAARGLRSLHAADLVHRDIKPENLFATADGHAKVGDLGIVQMGATTFRTRMEYGSERGHPGTPLYMSPEQANRTDPLTPEADQYSLGATLFELATGKRYKGIHPDERAALLGAMPAGAATLIRRMTQDDPQGRYRGMDAVLDALAAVDLAGTATTARVTRPPPVGRRAVLAGIGGLAVGGAGLAAYALRPHGPEPAPPPTATVATASPSRGTPGATISITAPSPPSTAGITARSAPQILNDPAQKDAAATAVAFAADGQTLASGAQDNLVRLWRADATGPIRTFKGHTGFVFAVAFSPDGQTLASGGNDKMVRLWKMSDGTLIRMLLGHTASVEEVVFSPDGAALASLSRDGEVLHWRVADGKQLNVVTTHAAGTGRLAFLPDGQTLAVAMRDKTISLLTVGDGALVRALSGHTDTVGDLDGAADGKTLVSAAGDKSVIVWRIDDGTPLRTISLPGHPAESVAFAAADGQTFATSGVMEEAINLWRAGDGTLARTLTELAGWVNDLAYSPKSRTLAAASVDGTLRLWSV